MRIFITHTSNSVCTYRNEYLHCACIARDPKSIAHKNMVIIMLLRLMFVKLKPEMSNEEGDHTMHLRNSWHHLTLIYCSIRF